MQKSWKGRKKKFFFILNVCLLIFWQLIVSAVRAGGQKQQQHKKVRLMNLWTWKPLICLICLSDSLRSFSRLSARHQALLAPGTHGWRNTDVSDCGALPRTQAEGSRRRLNSSGAEKCWEVKTRHVTRQQTRFPPNPDRHQAFRSAPFIMALCTCHVTNSTFSTEWVGSGCGGDIRGNVCMFIGTDRNGGDLEAAGFLFFFEHSKLQRCSFLVELLLFQIFPLGWKKNNDNNNNFFPLHSHRGKT